MEDISTGIGTGLASINTKAHFEPLTENGQISDKGIIHLYRDGDETPGLYRGHHSPFASSPWTGSASVQAQRVLKLTAQSPKDADCTTICILAVPSYFSTSDFLAFVGQDTIKAVSHFRMLRTARLNRYMVLMKFKDGKFARQWQNDWNGKVFSNMEPETCHVVFIKSVNVVNSQEADANDHDSSVTLTHTASGKPLAPPTPALVELPTCPVCLERMDESTGLLTIPCQHVFHCTCLEKWSGGGCPVCRYAHDDFTTDTLAQKKGKSKKHMSSGGEYEIDDEELKCEVCHETLSLWQCLICAKVGCGRYAGKHAYEHHKETGHAFALDLDSKRVWDYARDCYVHRIIADGSINRSEKLVELPGRRRDGQPTALEDVDEDFDVMKRENLAFEYTQLLTSQLDSQRLYFEELANRAADKSSDAQKRAELAEQEAQAAQLRYDGLLKSNEELREKFARIEKLSARYESRYRQLEEATKDLKKKYQEEKAISDNVAANSKEMAGISKSKYDADTSRNKATIQRLEEDNATKDMLMEALQEELRDLRFRLDAERKLREMIERGEIEAGELEGATISVGPARAKQPAKRVAPKSKTAEIAGPSATHASAVVADDLHNLLGSEYKMSSKWDAAQIQQLLLEKGLLERKEEEGLYDEDSDDAGEVAAGESATKSKAKRKKKGKKKK